ncbi:hypothetical protein [Stutzerimonas nitrititolerans]|uniref:hypothetical protein n=1 Tax=Stutzerimonas nitrititolerans TaxID=2482751 RepID=UPI0028A1CD65|nr:hypothetical protein [Stutzerimonas nitrititolerans]
MSKQVLVLLVGLFVMVEAIAVSSDSRYVEEFHSSVVVSERDEKIVVVFLRNNLKESIKMTTWRLVIFTISKCGRWLLSSSMFGRWRANRFQDG